jgi:hypothetical protein
VFVRLRSLWRGDHSTRGVLPTVLCHCVWSRNLKNEEAKTRKWVVKASKRWSSSTISSFMRTNYQIQFGHPNDNNDICQTVKSSLLFCMWLQFTQAEYVKWISLTNWNHM